MGYSNQRLATRKGKSSFMSAFLNIQKLILLTCPRSFTISPNIRNRCHHGLLSTTGNSTKGYIFVRVCISYSDFHNRRQVARNLSTIMQIAVIYSKAHTINSSGYYQRLATPRRGKSSFVSAFLNIQELILSTHPRSFTISPNIRNRRHCGLLSTTGNSTKG